MTLELERTETIDTSIDFKICRTLNDDFVGEVLTDLGVDNRSIMTIAEFVDTRYRNGGSRVYQIHDKEIASIGVEIHDCTKTLKPTASIVDRNSEDYKRFIDEFKVV